MKHEAAASLCIDANNSIYLTGATHSSSSGYADMLTIKIDSTSSLIWEETYDYNQLHDFGVKIALSGPRVVVTGIGQHGVTSWQAKTVTYMQVDGDLSSVSSSISSSNQGVDEVSDLVVDNNNNIYITGSTFNVTTGYDMLLIKLDEDLNLEWSVEWDGDGMTDKGSGVRVAPNGDVYITGTTKTSSNGPTWCW